MHRDLMAFVAGCLKIILKVLNTHRHRMLQLNGESIFACEFCRSFITQDVSLLIEQITASFPKKQKICLRVGELILSPVSSREALSERLKPPY